MVAQSDLLIISNTSNSEKTRNIARYGLSSLLWPVNSHIVRYRQFIAYNGQDGMVKFAELYFTMPYPDKFKFRYWACFERGFVHIVSRLDDLPLIHNYAVNTIAPMYAWGLLLASQVAYE